MARWKLMASHYLNTVNGTEWEYNETDRSTGRPKRMRVLVPRYLDIRDPGDWTNSWQSGTNMATSKLDREEGEIVVCLPGKGESRDIEFIGDPTPDMVPIDDEAREISAGFESHWRYKPDGGPVSYSQSMVDEFRAEMSETESKPATVQVEGLAELVAVLASQAKSTQDLINSMHPQRRL